MFGPTLQALLKMNNIKLGNLADCLGYDISYVSKWTSGAKLPSLKNNDELMENMARFFAANATPEGRAAMSARFFEGRSLSDSQELERALAELLRAAYQAERPKTEEKPQENNCILRLKNCIDDTSVFLQDGMARACRGQSVLPLEVITMVPFDLNGTKNMSLFSLIAQSKPESRPLRIRQAVYMPVLRENLDVYCRCICAFMWCAHNITYELYEVDADVDPASYMFIIKDGLMIFSANAPFRATPFNLLTYDRELVANYYNVISRYLYKRDLLVGPVAPKALSGGSFILSFLMEETQRYILREMQPLFMSIEMLHKLAERYIPDPAARENYVRLYSFSIPVPKQVVLYKSALIDYLLRGRLHIFGRTAVLSLEERAAHLNYILECFRQIPENELTILDDTNPILCRQDIQVSVFLGGSTAFAVRAGENDAEAAFRFHSQELIGCFNTFFQHLTETPESCRTSGEAALRLIEQLLDNLKRRHGSPLL